MSKNIHIHIPALLRKSARDAATVGKKYRTSKGIVTYLGPDLEGRHGDVLVKNASGFTLKMHEDDLKVPF